jgi:hypothetical protein
MSITYDRSEPNATAKRMSLEAYLTYDGYDKNPSPIEAKGSNRNYGIGGNRTHGLSLRRRPLYPTELQPHHPRL